MNDNTVSGSPVSGSSNLVGITSLKRIDNSEDFIELTTGRSRVGKGETDGLLGVDNVDGTDGEGNTMKGRLESANCPKNSSFAKMVLPLGVQVGQVLLVEHVLRTVISRSAHCATRKADLDNHLRKEQQPREKDQR